MSSFKRPLSRRRSNREQKKVFIISSEGKETEPKYFNEFNSDNIRIKIIDERVGTDPNSVVKAAKNYKKKEEGSLKKGDEIWVVVDTELSPETKDIQAIQLTEAGNLCKKYEFGYAASNPCFEYWLLLHFEKKPKLKCTIRIQDKCIHLLKNHYPQYDKSTYDPKKFVDKVKYAIENAKKLDQTRNGLWPENNGSTVYKLMEKLLEIQ
ncbi:RloB family protein [bacterium]|nr:RloB family protein [bacterium]